MPISGFSGSNSAHLLASVGTITPHQQCLWKEEGAITDVSGRSDASSLVLDVDGIVPQGIEACKGPHLAPVPQLGDH